MKEKLLLLIFIISVFGAKSQTVIASIDSSSVPCTNNYNLSISSNQRLSNQKSLKIKNGYCTRFSDYEIWSTSDDYAVAFWFKNINANSISILTNSMGISMSGSENRITLNQDQIILSSGSLQTNSINIDTAWNHIAMHVKKNNVLSRTIIYLNGVAIDSVNDSYRMEEFGFGDVNLEQTAPYEFLIDDVVLLIGDSLQNSISSINNDCNWSTSDSRVHRFYSFETINSNSTSFVDQLSMSYSKKISGINYSGSNVLTDVTYSCVNSYNILWNDGSTSWDRVVPSGNNYSAIVHNSIDTISTSINIPYGNTNVSGYIDLFPDTIISYGNTIDTVVNWFNWPPDTSVVYGSGYIYTMPQNNFTYISTANNQGASVNGNTVRFETSGIHKFYLSDWGTGNFCDKQESIFVEILDSINLVNRNDVCDTSAKLYPVNEVNRGILRLKGQSLKCTDISPFQDLEELSVSFLLYWKGGINQTLIKAAGLLDIYSISNDSLIVTDYTDTLILRYPLLEWNFLTVTSSASEFNIWVNDSLVCTKARLRNRNLNLATGFAIGRDIIYHPLSNTFGITGANYSTEFEGGLTEISFWDKCLDSTSVRENVFVLDLENPNLISSYDFDPWGQNPKDLSFRQKELHIYNYGLSGGYIYDFPEERKILQSGQFYSSNITSFSSFSIPAGNDFTIFRTYGLDTIEILMDSINIPILIQPKPDYGANGFGCFTDTVEVSLRGSYDSISVDQVTYSFVDTILYVLPSTSNQNFIITGYKDSLTCSYDVGIERYQTVKNSTIWNDTIICGMSEIDFTIHPR